MRNKLLKFADFKGGTDAQDPKKQINSAGGSPKKEKEKPFDQVKMAKLAQLDKTEPDYSKTKKMNEDAKALINDIAALKKKKTDVIAQIDSEIVKKEGDLQSLAIQASATTTTTISPANQTTAQPTAPATPAASAAQPTAPAQPGAPVQQK
jgi:hypothetical protein